ncbi:excisionase [Rathayibacter sp. AY1A7]|nr:excisionase [Rathayibacter sp. AY1A7]
MTEDDLAEYLKVPAAKVARMRRDGRGPDFVKVGREARYRLSDVERWLRDNTHTSTATTRKASK